MLRLCTLASGSGGNSLLLSAGETHVLVDAGISCRRITASLAALGLAPEDLSGILITHAHADHVGGLATLLKHCSAPVYASRETGLALCYRTAFLEERLCPFRRGEGFSVGEIAVRSFPTSHDSPGSVGYALSAGGRRAAVCTDLGVVTPAVQAGVEGCHLLVAETNHDIPLLRQGRYPYPLQERILGPEGHLSNEAGAELICGAVQAGAEKVLLAHLSAENNTPALALRAVETCLATHALRAGVALAPRETLSGWYEV